MDDKDEKLEKEIRREFKFKWPPIPKKRCGNCKHSYCHNPGAYITGLSCKLMERILKKRGSEFGISIVDLIATCGNWVTN